MPRKNINFFFFIKNTHIYYNDLGMIQASKAGFLFRSTDKIKADYPDIPAYETYDELLDAIKKAMV